MSVDVIVRAFRPGDGERWDAYVHAHADGHFGQRVAFRALMAQTYGVEPLWWLAERRDEIVGILPLFRRRLREPALFSAPGGMLRDDAESEAALVGKMHDLVRSLRVRYAELRDQRRPIAGLPTSDEHVTLEMPLEATAAEQWAAISGNARTGIRKARKMLDYTVARGQSELRDFYGVLLENMRDLGTPLRGIGYFRTFLEQYGEDASVLVVRAHGETLGGMLTVRQGSVVTDPWASSSRRWFHASPNDAVYWEAICAAIADGASTFDFGRSQPDSGTYRYKLKWGASPRPLAYQYVLGTAKQIPTLADQRTTYDLAVRVWRRLPLAAARLLGEPIKRLFPETL